MVLAVLEVVVHQFSLKVVVVVVSLMVPQVRVEVASDPHRVLRGTSAHMRRVEEQRGQDRQRKDSAFILHPHQSLAVPSWRTGT